MLKDRAFTAVGGCLGMEYMWYVIGFAGACLTMFGFVPQVVRMFKTKSVNDVSFLTLLQISVGALLWILYGLHIRDVVVVTANIVTLTTLIMTITLYLRYRKPCKHTKNFERS
ncbi:MAG: SemiSWEET family sugar transporter [Candidatus Bathyarchaeota archaeon]